MSVVLMLGFLDVDADTWVAFGAAILGGGGGSVLVYNQFSQDVQRREHRNHVLDSDTFKHLRAHLQPPAPPELEASRAWGQELLAAVRRIAWRDIRHATKLATLEAQVNRKIGLSNASLARVGLITDAAKMFGRDDSETTTTNVNARISTGEYLEAFQVDSEARKLIDDARAEGDENVRAFLAEIGADDLFSSDIAAAHQVWALEHCSETSNSADASMAAVRAERADLLAEAEKDERAAYHTRTKVAHRFDLFEAHLNRRLSTSWGFVRLIRWAADRRSARKSRIRGEGIVKAHLDNKYAAGNRVAP